MDGFQLRFFLCSNGPIVAQSRSNAGNTIQLLTNQRRMETF